MKKFLTTLAIILLSSAATAADAGKAKSGSGGGLVPAGNSKQPINIEANGLEVFQQKNIAIFSGNVIAKQGTMTVKSDKMTVHYINHNDPNTPKAPKPKTPDAGSSGSMGNSISKIDLDGNVFVTTPDESARGKTGYYDTQKKFIELVGDVVLTRDNNVLKGSKMDFDVDSGHGTLVNDTSGAAGTGRVKGLFIPQDNSGK